MWLGGEDQEVILGYKGPCCNCEGQARCSSVMDRRDIESLEKGLVQACCTCPTSDHREQL
jgi:hypothetical protein